MISKLRNLGKISQEKLAAIGISTESQLRAKGSVATYLALKQAGHNPSINFLWAIEGALTDRDWIEVAHNDRLSLLTQIEMRVNEIKTEKLNDKNETQSSSGIMRFSYLANHPQFLETLAVNLFKHWQPILTEDTLEIRIAKLKSHMSTERLPIAWVAHSDSEVFGTAALREHDLDDREDLAPWLGGVYVLPTCRSRGIGEALCKTVEQAAKLRGIDTLHLFTLDKKAWYTHLGWKQIESTTWHGLPADIMSKQL
ncbi:MAG: GNAT family N-acetyltransferase [Methyloglobulus sp.]|nr:GNAT family N-acetyltransferase [Methyloglobulus sp.]